jgi:hypothetical protein
MSDVGPNVAFQTGRVERPLCSGPAIWGRSGLEAIDRMRTVPAVPDNHGNESVHRHEPSLSAPGASGSDLVETDSEVRSVCRGNELIR